MRLTAFSIVGVLFAVFVLWPAWIVRPQVTNQIRSMRSQIELGKVQVRSEPALLEEKRKLEAFCDQVRLMLWPAGEIEQLLGVLSKLAEKSHVSLVSSQPEEQVREPIPLPYGDRYASVSYVITVEGGYHAIAAFVSEMENYSKILRVDEVSILPQETTPHLHLGELRISAFSHREGKK